MNFPNITSLNSMLRNTQMTMKWNERKDNIGKEERLKLQQAESPEIKRLREMAEDSRKSNYVEGLCSKLKSGGELTSEELEYLRANRPELYQDAVEISNERKHYKRELENCRTQEDVDRLNIGRLNKYASQAKTISANPNIPLAKKVQLLDKLMGMVMGMNVEFGKFLKSGAYDSLPKEEETNEKKKANKKDEPKIESTQSDPFEDTKKEIDDVMSEIQSPDTAAQAPSGEVTPPENASSDVTPSPSPSPSPSPPSAPSVTPSPSPTPVKLSVKA